MTVDDRSTAACLAAALEGDESAWRSIVDRHARLVASTVNGFRLDRHQSLDVAQVVWLRLVEHLGDIRDPGALASWLVVTARNECLRIKRQHQRPQQGHRITDYWLSMPQPDDVVILHDEHERLRAALGQLDQRCASLLVALARNDTPSYTSIADELSMPVGSIGPTRARCLEHLRRLFENVQSTNGNALPQQENERIDTQAGTVARPPLGGPHG